MKSPYQQKKSRPTYESYVKFKAPKTGKYVVTLTNLQGTDDKSVKEMIYYGFSKIAKNGKKYYLDSLSCYAIGEYDRLYENNYLEKLRVILDNYKEKYPEYDYITDDDYKDYESYLSWKSTDKIKFTVKLKKGQTYVYVIDNAGMNTTVEPYNDKFGSNHQSCLWGGNYMEAYSFDMNIEYRK